jgi:Ser-tRNA(Ala) deacylase AlaX
MMTQEEEVAHEIKKAARSEGTPVGESTRHQRIDDWLEYPCSGTCMRIEGVSWPV